MRNLTAFFSIVHFYLFFFFIFFALLAAEQITAKGGANQRRQLTRSCLDKLYLLSPIRVWNLISVRPAEPFEIHFAQLQTVVY